MGTNTIYYENVEKIKSAKKAIGRLSEKTMIKEVLYDSLKSIRNGDYTGAKKQLEANFDNFSLAALRWMHKIVNAYLQAYRATIPKDFADYDLEKIGEERRALDYLVKSLSLRDKKFDNIDRETGMIIGPK